MTITVKNKTKSMILWDAIPLKSWFYAKIQQTCSGAMWTGLFYKNVGETIWFGDENDIQKDWFDAYDISLNILEYTPVDVDITVKVI